MSEEDDIELILHDAGKEKETSEEKELDEEEEYLVEYDEDGDEEEEEEEEDYGMELITTGLLDREPVLSAVPPRVIQHDEGQMEVSTSPAFQCIDDLFKEGRITATKVALLKAKYTKMHDALKMSRLEETSMLTEAKQRQGVLDHQLTELERCEAYPQTIDSEVMRLREQLLKYNNELAQITDREYQLAYLVTSLQEENKIMHLEYNRMPKAGEVEKKLEELKMMCTEMRKEIGQRHMEAKNLKEDLEQKNRGINIESKQLEELVEQVESLKGDLVGINSQPGQLAKESDKIQRHLNETDKKHKQVDGQLRELTEMLRKMQERLESLSEEKMSISNDLDKKMSSEQDREREYHILMKDFEYAKEREAMLLGDKATLDLNLRHVNLEKKNTHDMHSRKSREKDRDLRNLKRMELYLRIAEDTLGHTQLTYDKLRSQLQSQPKDDGSLLQRRTELHKEVENAKRALANQNSLTAVETVKVEQSIAEEERLLYEQSDLHIEVVELTRLATIKNDEREQKARDFMRSELRFHRAEEDLKLKKLSIQDHQKKYKEMHIRLKDFAKLYDIIKNERNKTVNLIQTSTQKAAEMREKIKILQNEIEILRTAVSKKDRQLQKQRLRHVNAIVVRDSLRNEVSKQQHIEEEMREKREQQKMDIDKLNLLINQAEEQMVQLRKRYETAVQHRNDRGVQLIERNEEVAIFYEKVNIQSQMLRSGDEEMFMRTEEIRFLDIEEKTLKRRRELLRQTLPQKRAIDQELVTVQIQLSQCQDKMHEMEQQLEDPTQLERIRFLAGEDPTPAQLQGKLEQLEIRLATKEEHLLEKDLIFEQVCRITERHHTRAKAGKEDTVTLAKKVNELQTRIKLVTRRMMSMVSELSMHQAEGVRLQQDVREKELELELCYRRMEKGEPPNMMIEREWLCLVRDAEVKARDKDIAREMAEEEEQYTLPGGIVTTAEPRPNAYIPDDDSDLPIPRPYGSQAPFKPSESGATMRHIRKPVPKPIEI